MSEVTRLSTVYVDWAMRQLTPHRGWCWCCIVTWLHDALAGSYLRQGLVTRQGGGHCMFTLCSRARLWFRTPLCYEILVYSEPDTSAAKQAGPTCRCLADFVEETPPIALPACIISIYDVLSLSLIYSSTVLIPCVLSVNCAVDHA